MLASSDRFVLISTTQDLNWYRFVVGDDGHEIESYPIPFDEDDEFAPDFSVDSDISAPDWFDFQRLISQWHRERGITSSLTKIVTCPAYLRIIGMGEKAVPLILDQLEAEGDEPDFWFWALEAITGENPVRQDDVGNMRAMARAWLRWGGRSDAR